MAGNSWSPQRAIAKLVGEDAMDCGQFGPGVREPELLGAITCAQAAARDRKAFSTIRHYLSAQGERRSIDDNDRWLAEGLLAGTDGVMRHFEYRGFSTHVFYDSFPQPKPTVSESPCPSPRVVPDATGTVQFACGERPRP